MTKRAQQREETREKIIAAAVEVFAERGFRGASTREIARRASTNQGLITYHFQSKEELWRAAADRIFGRLHDSLAESAIPKEGADPREFVRERIRDYVRFAAAHPELFRFMVEQGKSDDPNLEWLVDRHLKPLYERTGVDRLPEELRPHAFYVLAGAGSVIFALAPECHRLTGLDPMQEKAIETHAEFVARLLVP